MVGATFAALGLAAGAAAALRPVGRVMAGPAPAGGAGGKDDAATQVVQLPFVLRDSMGTTWDISQDGSVNDGGNDLFDGGGHLYLDGGFQYNAQVGQVPFSPARNELVFPPQPYKGMNVSRRVAVDAAQSYIRFAEVFENPTAQAQKLQLRVYFNMGGSVQGAQPLIEEKGKKQQIGVALGDGNNAFGVIGCGRNSKVLPRFNPQQGTDNFEVFYDIDVPPKQTAVVVLCGLRRGSVPEVLAALSALKEKDMLSSLPKDLQKKVINFKARQTFDGGDLEILRGDLLDIVEMRGGDQYHGTIKEAKYRLKTFAGTIELPADGVVGLMNVGDYRPKQLVVTKDGEIFGGELERRELTIELSSGQATTLPVDQVARAGYRKRAGEPEEWALDKPMVVLRTGERMVVRPAAADLSVWTRCGVVKLNPAAVSAIAFQAEDHGVHEIQLRDGSKFAGLVAGDAFEARLATGGIEQAVKFPAAAIRRLQLGKPDESDDPMPSLTMANDDMLVGTLSGELRLNTAFSTMTLNAGEVKRVTHGKHGPQDVQVVLWDDTTVSGQLEVADVLCKTRSGVEIRVPVALVQAYENPRPQPGKGVIDAIGKLVGQLSADEWGARDEAQKKLVSMGPVVITVMKDLRAKQSLEGQQRIDATILMIEKSEGAGPAGGGRGPANGGGAQPPPVIELQGGVEHMIGPQFDH